MSRERPILFSAPLVRAILEGRKTQTRRVVKIPGVMPRTSFAVTSPREEIVRFDDGTFHYLSTAALSGPYPCPYGQPGDRLWVRETWYCDDYRVQRGPYIKPDDLDVTEARDDGTLVYAADGLTPYEAEQPVWRPSIHMPRWASRITLEVTGVRVERLKDISETDAVAEGSHDFWGKETPWKNHLAPVAVHGFAALWESVNGPGSWDANPWVWVIKFRRAKP